MKRIFLFLLLATVARGATYDYPVKTATNALSASKALTTDANGKAAASATTSTEIGYVSGVTSAIQTQLDAKGAATNGTFSGGTFTGATNDVLRATSTTDSSSLTTGSIIAAGGAGISKALYLGGPSYMLTSAAFPGAVTDRSISYYSSQNGLVQYGAGSVYDALLLNKSGSTVYGVPTGTQIARFFGQIGIGMSPYAGNTFDSTGGYVNSAATYGFWLGINATTPGGVAAYYHSDGTTNGSLIFKSFLGGMRLGVEGSANAVVIAKTSGNVGIGTSTPQYLLDLNGQARIIGTNGMRFGGTSGATDDTVRISQSSANNLLLTATTTTTSGDFVVGTKVKITTLTKTANYTLTSTDPGIIFADATGGAVTITLPAASASTIGVEYKVFKVDSSANAVTIAGNGGDTLLTGSTTSTTAQANCLKVTGYTSTSWIVNKTQ